MRGIVIALLVGQTFLSGLLSGQTGMSAPQLSLASRNGALRIVVVGDIGYGTDRVTAGIAKVAPIDAVIIPGDNIYSCGVQSKNDPRWKRIASLTTLGVPLFPVLGNHDYCGNPLAQINAPLPNWDFPAKQYTIRSDIAEFAMLDTNPYLAGADDPLKPFLRDAFSGDSKWRIAVGHHTVVSSGYHGYFPRSAAQRMRTLIPLLRATGVDLYVCGHDHHQELVDGQPRYLVSGAGSQPVPPIILRSETLFPATAPFREPIGFTLLEITKDQLAITFYDEHAQKRGGPIISKR